jgi:hypothetical protein
VALADLFFDQTAASAMTVQLIVTGKGQPTGVTPCVGHAKGVRPFNALRTLVVVVALADHVRPLAGKTRIQPFRRVMVGREVVTTSKEACKLLAAVRTEVTAVRISVVRDMAAQGDLVFELFLTRPTLVAGLTLNMAGKVLLQLAGRLKAPPRTVNANVGPIILVTLGYMLDKMIDLNLANVTHSTDTRVTFADHVYLSVPEESVVRCHNQVAVITNEVGVYI